MLTQIVTILIIVSIIGCILYGRRLIRTEKVDAVFEKDDDATIEAYSAKDGEYVVFNQKIFVGYKDPNSDEVLLKQVR